MMTWFNIKWIHLARNFLNQMIQVDIRPTGLSLGVSFWIFSWRMTQCYLASLCSILHFQKSLSIDLSDVYPVSTSFLFYLLLLPPLTLVSVYWPSIVYRSRFLLFSLVPFTTFKCVILIFDQMYSFLFFFFFIIIFSFSFSFFFPYHSKYSFLLFNRTCRIHWMYQLMYWNKVVNTRLVFFFFFFFLSLSLSLSLSHSLTLLPFLYLTDDTFCSLLLWPFLTNIQLIPLFQFFCSLVATNGQTNACYYLVYLVKHCILNEPNAILVFLFFHHSILNVSNANSTVIWINRFLFLPSSPFLFIFLSFPYPILFMYSLFVTFIFDSSQVLSYFSLPSHTNLLHPFFSLYSCQVNASFIFHPRPSLKTFAGNVNLTNIDLLPWTHAVYSCSLLIQRLFLRFSLPFCELKLFFFDQIDTSIFYL